MLRNRTVNLVKLSAEASGGTTAESVYRRFQNFFLRFAMPLEDIGKLVLAKLPKPADGCVLSMDRTNWKYGKLHINIRALTMDSGMMTLAFLVSYGWGCPMMHGAPLKSAQKRKSIFRLGLDRIAQMFSNRVEFEDEIYALASRFSRPNTAHFLSCNVI